METKHRINTLSEYLKKRFGQKTYKLSLNGGMTCPNRDGKIGYGGCIFCSNGGSGEFAEPLCEDIFLQIERAKKQVSAKIKGDAKYIAYFQSFTNTYAPAEYLEKIFTQAIEHEDVAALSIATRPDCLGEDVLLLLERLNRIKPVWVELGLQTIHERSIDYIRRGYGNDVFDKAAANLKTIGIEVIAHVILGLPGETKEDMLQTVRYLNHAGVDGVKLQLLHVLKNTDLERDYLAGKFDVLSLEEYIDILICCLQALSGDIVIHRMTGDGDKKLLTAPLWSANKRMVLNRINREIEERGVIQGSMANE